MDKLYELMDWAEIEAVVFAEEDHPRDILGARVTPQGVLIQAFFPGEEDVSVHVLPGKKMYPMEKQDEEGFFAVLLKGRRIPQYEFVTGGRADGKTYRDPYNYPCQITEKEALRFSAGIWYDAYQKLGAHVMEIKGVQGVYFAVWAPNAVRVSVVGDFNNWDGRVYQMNRMDCGIFELFIPGLEAGCIYKYELKAKNDMVYLKADPYANAFEQKPGDASMVVSVDEYLWHDEKWLEERRKNSSKLAGEAMVVYQTSLQEWADQAGSPEEKNYKALAHRLAKYVKEMGYTHVELTPVTEYPEDQSLGFEVCGYFAPTARYGRPKEFMYLVDYLHKNGIAVILDFVASYFAGGYSLLTEFDGTCLYEHLDPRKGIHPAYGTHIFNYDRPEVANFLISSMKFWAQVCHVDGLKITDLATMLYLDYGREFGQWEPNMYGEPQNLEAKDFVKYMNKVLHKETDVITLAEEMAGGWHVTGDVEEEIGLGFDLKWNHDWSAGVMDYMRNDPIYRGPRQEDLILSTVYAFSEQYMIGFGKDDVTGPSGSLWEQMPGAGPEGSEEENAKVKLANLKLAYAYMIAHPGKKLFYAAAAGMDAEKQQLMKGYVRDLLQLYKKNPALYLLDSKEASFEWISNLDAERNLLIFLRKTAKKEDTLLIICNFSNVLYEAVEVGVPAAGKYKEIFNSDAAKYGGSDAVNPRVKISKVREANERKDSITVTIPPLALSVYKMPAVKAKTTNKAAKAGKATASAAREEVQEALIELPFELKTKADEKVKKTLRESVRHTVEEAAEKAGKAAGDVAAKAGKAAGDVTDKAEKTAEELREKAGRAAGDVAEKAGKTAGELREKAGKAAGEVAEKAGKTAEELRDKAGKAAGDVAEKAGKTAEELRERAGKATGDVADKAGELRQKKINEN